MCHPRRLVGARSLAGALLLSLLGACAEPETGSVPPVLKVVASIPASRLTGDEFVHGARLALAVHHEQGGVPVELVIADNFDPTGKVVLAVERGIAQAAVADPAVVAYLGPPISDRAKVSMPLLNQAGIVQVSYGATWPGLTRTGFGPGEPGIYFPTGRRHFFRVVPTDDLVAPLAARWAHDQGWRRIHVVGPDMTFSRGAAGTFATAAQDLGLEVVGLDLFAPDTATEAGMAALADRVLDTAPDLVCFTGTASALGGALVRRLHQRQPSQPVLSLGVVVEPQFIEQVGAELAEGIYATALGIPLEQVTTPGALAFRRRYQQAHGREPPFRAGLTYEGMTVVLKAIRQAHPRTREGVLAAMDRLGPIDGLHGTWSFTAEGDTSLNHSGLWQVRDGDWAFVQTLRDP